MNASEHVACLQHRFRQVANVGTRDTHWRVEHVAAPHINKKRTVDFDDAPVAAKEAAPFDERYGLNPRSAAVRLRRP